ncbi:hypothetical protein J11TS1_04780 [Oceanobacillus sp. J11TS1]|nr:hypothetical protein J11TS1_04780 [Oceanobacillus sp. J11TS1]
MGDLTASNGPIRSTNLQWGMKESPPLKEVSLYGYHHIKEGEMNRGTFYFDEPIIERNDESNS